MSQSPITAPSAPMKKCQPKKSFRLEAKNLFLTYPQCQIGKKEALDHLLSLPLLKVKGAIVCQESHVDGEKHLHIGLFLEDRLRTRDAHYLDLPASSHGNYQVMKSVKGTLEYLKKEDPEPLVYGQVPEYSKSRNVSKSNLVAGMIHSGSSVEEIAEKEPGYFMLNKRKIEDYLSWYTIKKAKLHLQKLTLPLVYSGQDLATSDIVAWLNTNLCCKRTFKSPQLFLSGPPNFRKTSLILSLEKYLRVYHMPLHEDFYDFYADEDYDLIVLDEFKGQKTIQFLNEWLQGSVMNFRKKGSQGLKRENHPMIILSNFRLTEIYKDQYKVSLLQARLKEIELSVPVDIDNIIFQHVAPPSPVTCISTSVLPGDDDI